MVHDNCKRNDINIEPIPIDFSGEWYNGEGLVVEKKGGENMTKLYKAVVLNMAIGEVIGTQWVTAENKEQAFAKVHLVECDMNTVKVFLDKIGEY